MTPEAVVLYLEDNGITVTGNTDQYFRLSPDGVKEWSVNVPQPTQQEIDSFESQIPPKPITVSAWQIRKALNQLNLRTTIETAVSNSSDQDLKDGWEYAKEFESNNPLVLSMGKAIGKTESEMYQVFQLAETL
jgi:hypothetical protein